MSALNIILDPAGGEERHSSQPKYSEVLRDASRYAFVDVEVGMKDNKIHDIGALRWDGQLFHSADSHEALAFI